MLGRVVRPLGPRVFFMLRGLRASLAPHVGSVASAPACRRELPRPAVRPRHWGLPAASRQSVFWVCRLPLRAALRASAAVSAVGYRRRPGGTLGSYVLAAPRARGSGVGASGGVLPSPAAPRRPFWAAAGPDNVARCRSRCVAAAASARMGSPGAAGPVWPAAAVCRGMSELRGGWLVATAAAACRRVVRFAVRHVLTPICR